MAAVLALIFFIGLIIFCFALPSISSKNMKKRLYNERQKINQEREKTISHVEDELRQGGKNFSKRIECFSFYFKGENSYKTSNVFIGIIEKSKEIVFVQLKDDSSAPNKYTFKWQDIVSFNFNIDGRDFGNLKTASDITGILVGGATGYLASKAIGTAMNLSAGGKRLDVHSCTLTLRVNDLQNPNVRLQLIPKKGMAFYVDGKYRDYEMFTAYLENIAGTLNYIINNS